MKKGVLTLLALSFLTFSSIYQVSSCGNTTTKEIKEVENITLSGGKKIFEIGESFSIGDLTVIFQYKNGTTELVTSESYIIDQTNFDSSKVGEYIIKICAKDNEEVFASYLVNVIEPKIEYSHIEIVNNKELYYIGESFDKTKLDVYLVSDNDYKKEIDNSLIKVDLKEFDSSKEGDYFVTVSSDTYIKKIKVKVRKDYRKSFKVLTIGNSFSDDATEYIYQVAKGFGIENIIIGNMYVGGCTINQHKNFASSNANAYAYRKNTTGSFQTTSDVSLKTALENEEWDVITLQQGSVESGLASTYNSDLTYLINYIKTNSKNKNYKLGWHMTWAYQKNSTHYAFPTYDSNQKTMYESIVNAIKKKIITNENFDFIIPNGTAIQNARTSSLGDNLTRDGHHLTLDNGRFLAALTFVSSITGYNPYDLNDANFINNTAANAEIIKESSLNAINYPFDITYSKTVNRDYFLENDFKKLNLSFEKGYYEKDTLKKEYKLIKDESSLSFALDKVLTNKDLINGSVISLKRGYRYNALKWDEQNKNLYSPNEFNLEAVTYIDNKWWDENNSVTFTISSITDEKIDINKANDIFSIYIPNAVDIKE